MERSDRRITNLVVRLLSATVIVSSVAVPHALA